MARCLPVVSVAPEAPERCKEVLRFEGLCLRVLRLCVAVLHGLGVVWMQQTLGRLLEAGLHSIAHHDAANASAERGRVQHLE